MKQVTRNILFCMIALLLICASACSNQQGYDGSTDGNSQTGSGNSSSESNKENDDEISDYLGAQNKTVQKFISFVIENQYAEAIKQYQNGIAGNAKLESEASDCIENYLKKIEEGVLKGEYDQKAVKVMTKTVSEVYDSTGCQISGYSTLNQNIEKALDSKVAYKSGLSLFESGNYKDAITEFKKVLAADSDYEDAVAKCQEAQDAYKKEKLDKVKSLLDAEDYLSAIALLKEASAVFPEDADFLAQLNACEKNYIAKTLSDAEAVFTDYTKYKEAVNIINAAIQHYPNDKSLEEKKEYYMQFQPVSVYDMEPIKGSAYTSITDTDTYGNQHEKNFMCGFTDDTDTTFNLKKAYNLFTATIYGRSSDNEIHYESINIYADGNMIYEKISIPDNSTPPFDIQIDVTGVTELRIVMTRISSYGRGIGMTNMFLQKTS